MRAVDRCPLCDSARFALVAVEDDLEIVRCRHCRHGFSRQVMVQDEVKAWYEGGEWERYASERLGLVGRVRYRGDFTTVDELAHQVVARRADVVARYSRPGPVLEVGCGDGRFVAQCSAVGVDAYGLDLDRGAVEAAASRLQSSGRVAWGDLPGMPISWGPFVAVCVFHTLEHILDPRQFLEDVGLRLRPGGLLFIEVPNLDFYLYSRALRRPFSFFPRNHVHHFSAGSLSYLLSRAGFRTSATLWWGHVFKQGARLPMSTRLNLCLRQLLFYGTRHRINFSDSLFLVAQRQGQPDPWSTEGGAVQEGESAAAARPAADRGSWRAAHHGTEERRGTKAPPMWGGRAEASAPRSLCAGGAYGRCSVQE